MDANQPAIVAALRAAGRTVEVISDVGRGVPDLLVGHQLRTFCLEVKAPRKRGDLTPVEMAWMARWRGHYAVVTTPQEAIEATR